jgi:thiamine-phosphate pyrophosphorylase
MDSAGFSDCSPAAARAVTLARTLHAQPTAWHLLAALLAEEDSPTAERLQTWGVSDFSGWPSAGGLQLDTLLREADRIADEYTGQRTATSEHLLLALWHADPTVRAEFVRRGAKTERVPQPPLSESAAPLPPSEPFDLSDPTEWVDTARVVDANANRAREALRVLEDAVRFGRDDASLSGLLKTLRHDLTAALDTLPAHVLLASRDTVHDVGTHLSTPTEYQRASVNDVLTANAKRLQESLRSLEEFGKRLHADLGSKFERLRYRAYTLERALLGSLQARTRLQAVRLYALLTGAQCAGTLDWTIAEAAAGGVQMIQLREKQLADRELVERARNVRRWTATAGVLFIVNDRPDIARLVGADGVHLGQDDLSVKDARRIVGPEALIGVSTHTLAQVEQAQLNGADYLGVGPCLASTTKEFAEFAGLAFVRAACAATSLPAFAIGGINERTIDAVLATGATRVAVSAAIATADEPRPVALALSAALYPVLDRG